MRRRRKFFGLAVVAVLLGLVVVAPTARAATESLTLSPPQGKFALLPGQQVGSAIKLKNSGEAAIDVTVYTEIFSIKNELYDQEFNKADNPAAASNWIKPDRTSYHLEPKAETTVNYNLKVPPNAEPGGHYVALFAQVQSSDASKQDVIEIKRVASLLYIEIAGAVNRSGTISSLESGYWHKNSPIKSQLRLSNSGNTHYQIDGYVTIKNLFSHEVSKVRVSGLLMPRTTRLFETNVEAPSWPGLYRLEAKVSFPNGSPQAKSLWILYLPPLYFYAAVVALIVGLGVIAVHFHRRRSRKI